VAQLRQALDGHDERVELEGAPLSQDSVEQLSVVATDAAPQHEVLRPLDGPRRVDLDASEVARDLEHGSSCWWQGRRPEECGRDRNPPRVTEIDGGHTHDY
jgi:hypothetical protein